MVADTITGKPDKEPDHPSQSRAVRHPIDMRLRRAGYTIYSRPRTGEALWLRNGDVVRQSEALAHVMALEKKLNKAG